jgi:uncharacterized protein (DUF302 family)
MRYLILLIFAMTSTFANADPKAREGWVIHPTHLTYSELINRVKAAAKKNKMGVVTEAGPTGAAKTRGISIPGNRVIGVFNNVFAVEMLNASESAMIEAPLRFYVTEQADGTATLSYKTPSHVFSPYADGSSEVMKIAARLDASLATIAAAAVK